MTARARALRATLLWLLGMAGVAVLLHAAQIPPSIVARSRLSEQTILLLTVANNAALLAMSVGLGAFIAHRVGFVSLIAHATPDLERRIAAFPIYFAIGAAFGASAFLADRILNTNLPDVAAFNQANAAALSALDLGLWERVLYSSVTEEIVLRWGLMSFLTWLALKIVRHKQVALVIGIGVSAALFSLAHLPALLQLVDKVPQEMIFRVTALNFALCVGFGVAYARNSLEAAMLTHIAFNLGIIGMRLI